MERAGFKIDTQSMDWQTVIRPPREEGSPEAGCGLCDKEIEKLRDDFAKEVDRPSRRLSSRHSRSVLPSIPRTFIWVSSTITAPSATT